jgi:hypothetical protein
MGANSDGESESQLLLRNRDWLNAMVGDMPRIAHQPSNRSALIRIQPRSLGLRAADDRDGLRPYRSRSMVFVPTPLDLLASLRLVVIFVTVPVLRYWPRTLSRISSRRL